MSILSKAAIPISQRLMSSNISLSTVKHQHSLISPPSSYAAAAFSRHFSSERRSYLDFSSDIDYGQCIRHFASFFKLPYSDPTPPSNPKKLSLALAREIAACKAREAEEKAQEAERLRMKSESQNPKEQE